MDTSKLYHYTIRVKNYKKGTVIKENSLLRLMKKCRDLSEEDTQLHYIGSKLGASVDRTPTCHTELADKGIKYSWGCTKIIYLILKLKDNRGKEIFLKSISHCISNAIITTEMVIKYYAKSRRCIKSYHCLHASKLNNVKGTTQSACLELSLQEIKKMAKNYKTHQYSGYSRCGHCTEGLNGSVI